jgi:multidrug transporter EmrE-like cation transporter
MTTTNLYKNTMGYLFLLLTIIVESAAVIFMKMSDGFHAKVYAAIAVITYITSFIFLTLALKYLPAGLANAIWAGASVLLVAISGSIFFKEQITGLQMICFALIILGIVGLQLTGKSD